MIMKMDEKACRKCGSRGKRSCPALQGPICPACCGAGRVDPIPCPPECPYNPFGPGNYDQFLRVDETWQHKASDYVMARFGNDEFFKWVKRFSGASAKSQELDMILVFHHLLFVHQEGAAVREWEERGAPELNHDERLLMRYRKGQVVTVMEIQKVLDDTAMRCVDLLDPERGAFMLHDRSTAAVALPYSRYLVGLARFPHFSRLVCGGLVLDHDLTDPFLDALHREAGSNGDRKALRQWLTGHLAESMKVLTGIAEERRERMLRSVDIHHCRAFYRLVTPRDRVRETLLTKPDFQADPESRTGETLPGTERLIWLRQGKAAAFKQRGAEGLIMDAHVQGIPTLGNLLLTPTELIVETFSRAKFDFAKGLIERYLGGLIAFERETDQDMADELRRRLDPDRQAARQPSEEEAEEWLKEVGDDEEFGDEDVRWDNDEEDGLEADEEETGDAGESQESGVPQEVQAQALSEFYRKRYIDFLDEAVPALSGKTPREASRDPALRPRLIELMKRHINGMARDCREKNCAFDWTPTLSELGLKELM